MPSSERPYIVTSLEHAEKLFPEQPRTRAAIADLLAESKSYLVTRPSSLASL